SVLAHLLSRPTLFPYTTLFRSPISLPDALEQVAGTRLVVLEPTATVPLLDPLDGSLAYAMAVGPEGGWTDDELSALREHGGVAVDRKSTRLNSSHRTISYAVFC